MKKQGLYKPFDKVLLRTPLHSVEDAMQCFNFELKASYANASPSFIEGVYLSSPDFLIQLEKALASEGTLSQKDFDRLYQTWCKYWVRSSTRCTPYGTFAGCNLVKLGIENSVNLTSPSFYQRHVRLDMNCISNLISAIASVSNIKQQLLFFANNSVYKINDTYRFAEYSIKNNQRFYVLNSIEYSEPLSLVLNAARHGARISTLISLLIGEEISFDEASSFIDELIESQILLNELEPNITGEEPLGVLIKKVKKLDNVTWLQESLENLADLMEKSLSIFELHSKVEKIIESLNFNIDLSKNILQTDTFFKTKNGSIANSAIDTIVEQVSRLSVISRRNNSADMEAFIKRFYEKYEMQKIPLLIALDAELGIGYANVDSNTIGGNDLIDSLPLPSDVQASMQYDFINQFVYDKYHEYVTLEKACIEITDDDLEHLAHKNKNVNTPDSKYILGNLLLDQQRGFVFNLKATTGPSAINLLARFAHGNKAIEKFVHEIVTAEEMGSDKVYAEIVHLPESRVGNVLLRPILRNFEIPYIGNSGADISAQISLDDILIHVDNTGVVLTSKTLNRKIIPRLSTAHNFYLNSLPIYKFLCDLQYFGYNSSIDWDWGFIEKSNYLPRVIYKNVILKCARWTLNIEDLSGFPEDDGRAVSYFEELRKIRKMPKQLLYVEGDNELLIDFTIKNSLMQLVNYLKLRGNVILKEYLFDKNNCFVEKEGKAYANEIVIPVCKNKSDDYTSEAIENITVTNYDGVERKFLPGSEWLYLKIYCGSRTAEKVLVNVLLPFVANHTHLYEKFFFIRYYDTQSHIRVRFYNGFCKENNFIILSELMNALKPFIDQGLINKVCQDTYEREIERYGGGEFIGLSESIFYYDSISALKFISLLDGYDSEFYRWILAMRGVDFILADFHYGIKSKSLLLKRLQKSFFDEFGSSLETQKYLNEKYRQRQRDIFNYMSKDNDATNGIEEVISAFEARSIQNTAIVNIIYDKADKQKDKISALVVSYIHMFINRIFIAQNRKHELVIYHFLDKYYSSQLAIQKNNYA